MRLLLALCLIMAVVVVTITPASAEPRPGFGSWLRRVRDRIKSAVDKYKPRVRKIVETYNGVRDSWRSLRELFRGRRSVDELEYRVPVDDREDKLVADLDDLVESIVAEVIAGEIIDNKDEEDGAIDVDLESDEEESPFQQVGDDVHTSGPISYHPKDLTLN